MFKPKKVLISVTLLLAFALILFGVFALVQAATAPDLGTAESYGVLGGSTVTNTGTSIVNGNVGVSPGLAVTGFPPGIVVPPGTIHLGDAHAQLAQNDVTTAYNILAGQPCDFNMTGIDLGGLTLTPGVYCFSSSAQLTGQLTLDAQGNDYAVFIFQIGSTLTTASGSSVTVINATKLCNLFWQVGSSATLGTVTAFQGDIIALTSITLNTGATLNGRALARNGAVTLDTNTITLPICSMQPTSTVPPATSTVIAATQTAIASTPTSTLPAATSTVIAATQTAVAATNTLIAPTLTAQAATIVPTLTAQAATLTATAVAPTKTAIAATRTATAVAPTKTAVAATQTATARIPTKTPTPKPTVTPVPKFLPETGFSQRHVTLLDEQPVEKAFTALKGMWLEIPSLNVLTPIMGVPQVGGEWDVSWLSDQVGWLHGSSFPTLSGNSVITGHVWDASNLPGPFLELSTLRYGDQVIVHAWGAEYTYDVRSVKYVSPTNVDAMMKHEEKPWLTLVTCQGYDEAKDLYKYRVLIRAVLVEVN